MRFLFRVAILWTLLALPTPALADYLEVTKPATLKSDPSPTGDVLSRPDVGVQLSLHLNGKQTNGYYQATDPTTGKTGWIYRTLVRRYRGTLLNNTGIGDSRPGLFSEEGASPSLALVHFVDVDQGNAAILEFSCGLVMIDAGGQDENSTENLTKYLDALFDRRPDLDRTIDSIFITHTHKDHNLSLQAVVERYTVENYVWNGDEKGSGSSKASWMIKNLTTDGRDIDAVDIDDNAVSNAKDIGGYTDDFVDPVDCPTTDPRFHVLSADHATNPGWTEDGFGNGNNRSLVVRMDFGKASFLFTGDLEDEAIETMVDWYAGTDLLDTDVYLVGHHGSANGTTQSLLDAISPKIAVISMGKMSDQRAWSGWQYGHPRRQIVEMLNNVTQPLPNSNTRRVQVAVGQKKFQRMEISGSIYATGWDGTVVIAANRNGGLEVSRATPIN